MQCTTFQQQLDELVDGTAVDAEALREHAMHCDACARQLVIERRFRTGLRALATVSHDAARSERLLTRVRIAQRSGNRRQRIAGYAVAACLMVGVGVGVLLPRMTAPVDTANTARLLAVTMDVEESVRLVFRSPSELKGARIELVSSDGVELAGEVGRTQLSWEVDLHAGANLLELPVRLRSRTGIVTATITHDGGTRSFQLQLKSRQEAGARRDDGVSGFGQA